MPDPAPLTRLLDPFAVNGSSPALEQTATTKQVRAFTCPDCGAHYAHDEGYRHATQQCPARHRAR